MSSQQQLSSHQISHKPVENLFQREVVAPDRPPRVRWHSSSRVKLYRHGAQILIFLLFLIFCLVFGPSIFTFMYPYLIIPFNSDLEWRCKHLESYSQLDESTLAIETNLRAASSEVNIQIHLKDNITPDRIERVLLVIDDCGFDDFKGYIVLCRPVSYSVTRMRFSEYVKMAEICYHYVRQMMSNAQIAGYGRGITANILVATAAKLQEEYCYSFSALFAEDPIPNVRAEYEKKRWSGIAFMPASQRDEMIEETVQEYGLNEAEFENYIEHVNASISIITDYDFLSSYGHNKGVVHAETKALFEHMKSATKNSSHSTGYVFRHESEEFCVRRKHLPLSSVLNI